MELTSASDEGAPEAKIPVCKACVRAGARATGCFNCIRRERVRAWCQICERKGCDRSKHPEPKRPLICSVCGQGGHNRRRHNLPLVFVGPSRKGSGKSDWERQRGLKALAEEKCRKCWKRTLVPGMKVCRKHLVANRRGAMRYAEKQKAARALLPPKVRPLTSTQALALECLKAKQDWTRPRDIFDDRRRGLSYDLDRLVQLGLVEKRRRRPSGMPRFLYRAVVPERAHLGESPGST
jgi:hypothetical protein